MEFTQDELIEYLDKLVMFIYHQKINGIDNSKLQEDIEKVRQIKLIVGDYYDLARSV